MVSKNELFLIKLLNYLKKNNKLKKIYFQKAVLNDSQVYSLKFDKQHFINTIKMYHNFLEIRNNKNKNLVNF